MRTLLTADDHWGHGNIMKYCRRFPFMTEAERNFLAAANRQEMDKFKLSPESVERMDAALIDNINKMAGPKDEVIFVGDICWGRGPRAVEVCRQYLSRIRCPNLYLFYGNHDAWEIGNLFKRAWVKKTLNIHGHPCVFNHEAMAIWDRRNHGAYHFYGHSHSRAEEWLDQIMPGRFSIDVGVDNAFRLFGEYRPFDFEADILPVFKDRPGFGVFRDDEEDV